MSSVTEAIALRKEISNTLNALLPDLSDETALQAMEATANALGQFADDLATYGPHMPRAARTASRVSANGRPTAAVSV